MSEGPIYSDASGVPFDPQPIREPLGWIARVKEADAEAEKEWRSIREAFDGNDAATAALIAIAAELRAQRIARRPGAGQ